MSFRRERRKDLSLLVVLGVVYISPVIGQHYPAFVHVYRCETAHTAQKFLSRLRSYLLIESHRLRIVQLEEQLLQRNLLNIDLFNARKSQQNKQDVSPVTPVVNSNHQPKTQFDPIKSITQELQKKIDSDQPILFPPKDYDTLHAAHGNLQRAQAWKSTEVRECVLFLFSELDLYLATRTFLSRLSDSFFDQLITH